MTVHNAHVRLSPVGGGSPVILPVDSLTVRAVPYNGDGSTVITLFRGERIFVPPTFGYTIEMAWENLSRDLPKLREAIDLFIGTHAALVKNLFVEETSPGTFAADKYVPDVIPEITADTLNVVYEQGFHRKRASLTLHSKQQTLELFDWVAE